MRKKSIGINAILNSIKTISGILFPLITFPYATRILHVDNIGIYNFCASIISYFILLAGLGINNYSIREGAKYKSDRNAFSQFASEIFSINLLSTLISYLLLFVLIALVNRIQVHSIIVLVLSIQIVFTTIGCEWVFAVQEDFGYITLRSIVFQFISLILLFIMVRTERNLINYAIIHVIATTGSNLINCFAIRKYCKLRFIINSNTKKHLKPILVLFATTVASTIYVNSDITILGFYLDDNSIGLYAVATKMYSIIKTIIGSIIVVSIPRLSSYLSSNSKEKYNELSNKLFNILAVIILPFAIGLFSLSENIIVFISGDEYINAAPSLKVLSGALVVCLIGWFYAACILLVNKCEREILLATVISALSNIMLNIVLIPLFGIIAAAITTFIAELINMIIGFHYGKKHFVLSFKYKDRISIVLGGGLVFCICLLFRHAFYNNILSIVLSFVISSVTYFFILLIFKNSSIEYLIEIVEKRRIKKT